MAAKRRRFNSSSSRPKAATRRKREPAERALQADRDGRYQVTCPKCTAGYRVPEDYLDQRLTCKSCKAVFTPRTVLAKPRRARRKDYSGLVAAIVAAVLLVVALIAYNAIKGEEKKPDAPPPQVATLDMGHPAWLAWTRFCDAMSHKDQIGLIGALDIEHYYTRTAGKKAKSFDRLSREERLAWEEKEIGTLFGDEKWRMLREFEPSSPNTFPPTPPDVRDLQFECIMKPRDGDWQGDGKIQVHIVKNKDGLWKVQSFETLRQPRMKQLADSGRKVGYHKKLGKGTLETVKDSTGRTFKVRVIEPQPLDHLEDTPPALRKEIDQLLETLKDPNLPGGKLLTTRRRLEEIGLPAMPRILTQFYETRTSGLTGTALQDNINYLNLLTRILRTVSMHPGFGFNPVRGEDGALGITDAERTRALKAWFGWYSAYGWKLTQESIEKKRHKADEEIDIEGWDEHKKKKRAEKGKK